MFFDVHELERQKILFERDFLPGQPGRPGQIDLGEDVWLVEPLHVSGTAELVGMDIRLRGSLRTVVEICCDRCLEPTRRPVEMEFDLFYHPIQSIARVEEVEIKKEDLDVGFYHGDGLRLEDAVKEQVLLSLPMKTICRPDCKGLCPRCGQNRNIVPCGCEALPADPRWAVLEKFKQ